jgi:ppGpp synthetase/RelA/SpoT-type nucleotidyltranferase
MNYNQFIRDEFTRYELFAKTVADILHAAINAQPRNFRLVQIKFRAKDPKSLKRKLTERGLLDSSAIETDLKDLAGCRLFLHEHRRGPLPQFPADLRELRR